MNMKEKEAIQGFFSAIEKLKECNIIRSETYLGDIAEFLVKDTNGVDLALSLRQEGYDGIYKTNKKVQVKSHFGTSGTNILFKYDKNEVNFDDLIVILGPYSNLKLIKNYEFETYIFEDFKKWVSCGDSGINYNKTNKTVSLAKKVLKKNREITESRKDLVLKEL
ncbi:DUF6998 domain-containing protein [Lactococcus lactis]|uniref:DUF6998 domain-containing protein n=1 Tax=Lactococcus lactis TaxID=1358 RepID=UPI00300E04F3